MSPPREPLDVAPFVMFLQARIDRIDAGGDERGMSVVLREIGWNDDAGLRRWHRWRFEVLPGSGHVDRVDIEDALFELGVPIGDIYPELANETDVDVLPDAWCGQCAERVTPLAGDDGELCPWCDTATQRFDIPRPPAPAAQPEPQPAWTVRHRPRGPIMGRPVYLDIMLSERRKALEAFVQHGEWKTAAAAIRPGIFASVDSAALALRNLAVREGWAEGGKGYVNWQQRRENARAAIAKALADGTWDRVIEQRQVYASRRAFGEDVVLEAAWLYFYEELSFMKVAERLLSRTTCTKPVVLQNLLLREWNQRGWPRRTRALAAGWTAPTDGRCAAQTKAGKPCARWASKGSRYCFDHDPDPAVKQLALARNRHASAAANHDAMPRGPWQAWLTRKALPEVGSVRALHKRIGGVVDYGTLTDWTQRYAGNSGRHKLKTVRRSTIERVLAAWDDGTTFEDIYVPATDREASAA